MAVAGGAAAGTVSSPRKRKGSAIILHYGRAIKLRYGSAITLHYGRVIILNDYIK